MSGGATVHFPVEEIKAKLDAAGRDFETERADVLHAVGVQLLSFVQLDYDVKSRGGTGSDGIAWAPLAASTVAKKSRRGKRNEKRKTTKGGKARPTAGAVIGVDTGLQRASAQPGFSAPGGGNLLEVDATGVTIGFARHYSVYFDAKRQLLPTTLPPKWREACEGIVMRWAERILGTRLNG